MRILLRNTKTGQFYQGPDHWTDHPGEALVFDQSRPAINLAFEMGFKDVELYFPDAEASFPPPPPSQGNHPPGYQPPAS